MCFYFEADSIGVEYRYAVHTAEEVSYSAVAVVYSYEQVIYMAYF